MFVSPSKTSIARTPLSQSQTTPMPPPTTAPANETPKASVIQADPPTPLHQQTPSTTSAPSTPAAAAVNPTHRSNATPSTHPNHVPAPMTPSAHSTPSTPAAIDQAALIAAFGVWLQESPMARAQLEQIGAGGITDAAGNQEDQSGTKKSFKN